MQAPNAPQLLVIPSHLTSASNVQHNRISFDVALGACRDLGARHGIEKGKQFRDVVRLSLSQAAGLTSCRNISHCLTVSSFKAGGVAFADLGDKCCAHGSTVLPSNSADLNKGYVVRSGGLAAAPGCASFAARPQAKTCQTEQLLSSRVTDIHPHIDSLIV